MKFKKEILITGGAGFIGSHLTHYFVKKYSDYKITNIDALTYASNYDYIRGLEEFQNYNFEKIDINDYDRLDKLFKRNNFDYVLHLAAESHVDNSIENPVIFAKTNIIGTLNLLNLSKKYWKDLSSKIFYHISTDEVYGSLTDTGYFKETTPYDPRSPYSASKASSDHFVRAFYHTYKLPVIISNCSNNFGPNQNNEKLIPVVINSILNNNQIPVYGSGKNIRDWLYVEDHVMAIDQILTHGQAGETYNIGGGNELSNIELINKIILEMDKILDRPEESSLSLIKYVEDRKGHDFRYAIDCSKLSSELGWHPQKDFKDAIKSTIKWYIDNL
jgi:dTDP-glucose 4,6-dehydratase|tara:strand:+ start:28196 stop:29188 length:993 start_codon:yes stop_codon:yes gene_type:complete